MQFQPLDWEDSLGEENGNPLQYSCLENPMDRGAWWLRGVCTPVQSTWLQKSWTQLSNYTEIIPSYSQPTHTDGSSKV